LYSDHFLPCEGMGHTNKSPTYSESGLFINPSFAWYRALLLLGRVTVHLIQRVAVLNMSLWTKIKKYTQLGMVTN